MTSNNNKLVDISICVANRHLGYSLYLWHYDMLFLCACSCCLACSSPLNTNIRIKRCEILLRHDCWCLCLSCVCVYDFIFFCLFIDFSCKCRCKKDGTYGMWMRWRERETRNQENKKKTEWRQEIKAWKDCKRLKIAAKKTKKWNEIK